jgi:tetrahydromethanopterin S-methyltransferase subunit B
MAEPGATPYDQVIARRFQAIEQQIAELRRPTGSQNNRNKDKVQEALDKIAEQVDTIEGVVDDLQLVSDYQASLRTYTGYSSGSLTQLVVGTTTFADRAPSVAFTLPEKMIVLATLRTTAFLSVSGPTTSTLTATATARMRVEGNLAATIGRMSQSQTVDGSGGNHGFNMGGNPTAQQTMILDAGDHVIDCEYLINVPNGASVNCSIADRSLVIQILGRPD